MTPLFNATPVRARAGRGSSSFMIRRRRERWPPDERDEADLALVAAHIVTIGRRLRRHVGRIARAGEVPADLVELLLLFSAHGGLLRIVDIAELLGIDKGTASRVAARAEECGLIDKMPNPIDLREVDCRLSVAGAAAVDNCLEALRPYADEVLRPLFQRADCWASAAGYLSEAAVRVPEPTYISGWRAGYRAGMPAGE